jgi:1,4-alpha-glucan branching enzyme
VARAQDGLELASPSDVLARWPRAQVVRPSASSWGDGGYSEVWLAESNAWIHRHLAAVGRRALAAVAALGAAPTSGSRRRAVEQALGELLLAQASDWPFLIRAGTARDYADSRIRGHLGRAWALLERAEAGAVDADALAHAEQGSPLFSRVDLVTEVHSIIAGAMGTEERCSQVC